jgi:Tol biopolymer transport system component/DNA-binding winged helix-turn-helix (wHTH) protein
MTLPYHHSGKITMPMTNGDKVRIKFGAFEVDLRTRELWKNGLKLKLGGQPIEILATLLERPGELVTREQLRSKIWSADTFVDFNHGLNAAVNKLRECLNDSPEEPRYIETLPRRGYRFIAKTEKMADELLAAPPPPLASEPEPNPPDFHFPAAMPAPHRLPYLFAALTMLLFIVAFGIWKVKEPAMNELREKLAREGRAGTGAEIVRAPSIWHLDLTRPADPDARTVVTSARDRNEGPQPSPDGKKLAFMSDRSGSLEIWTSNRDGSSLVKLTNLGGCGSPKWSPDGRWIAFDAVPTGRPSVFLVSADGGSTIARIADESENMVPSWSRDGQWIYFASNRTGKDQVWKVPAQGGQPLQVTRGGGFAALESYDGRTIYYAKTRFEDPEIWQVPAQGGAETLVSPMLRPGIWANWATTQKGILFLSSQGGESQLLEFFDFATRAVQPIGILEKPSFWLSASSDGKSAWYTEGEQEVTNAALR